MEPPRLQPHHPRPQKQQGYYINCSRDLCNREIFQSWLCARSIRWYKRWRKRRCMRWFGGGHGSDSWIRGQRRRR
eukprot:13814359-Ditylum_brightwellii.AAC.1